MAVELVVDVDSGIGRLNVGKRMTMAQVLSVFDWFSVVVGGSIQWWI